MLMDIIEALFSDAMNLFFGLVQVVLAVVATVIAVNQRREQKYDMRCDDLKKTVSNLNSERYSFYLSAAHYYDELFEEDAKGEKKYSDASFVDVLYKNEWMTQNDRFLPLGDVVINIPEPITDKDGDIDPTADVWDRTKNPEAKFLPDRNDGYADNAKYHCGINLRNLPLYGLKDFRRIRNADGITEKIEIDVKKGYYFDFYDTCEVMSAEIAYYRRIKKVREPERGILPIRDSIEPFDLTNRFAGIGIITLTILEDVETDGKLKNYFLCHKRTQRVAEGTGSYHAVPAGSFQPAAVEFPKQVDPNDRNLKSTVIREFGEELLANDEFENLYNSSILAELILPEPVFVGIGLDPLNLKTELMACMVINVQEDSRKEVSVFRGETTYEGISKIIQKSYEGEVTLKELKPNMMCQFIDNPMSIPAFSRLLRTVLENDLDISRFKVKKSEKQ